MNHINGFAKLSIKLETKIKWHRVILTSDSISEILG